MSIKLNNKKVVIDSVAHNSLDYTSSYVELAHFINGTDLDDSELEELTELLIENGQMERLWDSHFESVMADNFTEYD